MDTLLRLLGAQTNSSINKSVNYLVIGTLASRDWLYTSHGRKIEKALLLKRGGSIYTKIIPDASSATLFPIMAHKTVPGSIVYSDG